MGWDDCTGDAEDVKSVPPVQVTRGYLLLSTEESESRLVTLTSLVGANAILELVWGCSAWHSNIT